MIAPKLDSEEVETAPETAPFGAPSDDDQTDARSTPTRRGSSRAEELPIDKSESDRTGYVPRYWSRLALFVVGAMVFSAVAGSSVPPLLSVVAALIAAAIAYKAPLFARIEQKTTMPIQDIGVALVAVLLPILLAAIAFSYWIIAGHLEFHWGAASLVSLTAVTTALLGNRVALIFTGQSACWISYALIDRSPHAIGATCAATLVLVLITRYRARITRLDEERQRRLERRQKRAETILRDYENTGQGWFWETDRRGQLAYLSPSVALALGRKKNELEGRPLVELFDLKTDNREGERTLMFHLSARSPFTDLAVRANTVQDERWWSISGRPIFDEFQNFCGFRGSGTDLTEKRKSAEHASRLAMFDSLTGLANRHQMSQSLEKILSAPIEMHRECAVLLLDLDRFKHVNDTLGHPAGDALLKQVAQRLLRAVGKHGRVGRLGGDEFKVIVPGRVDRAQIGALARDIIASLSQSYSIEGQRVVIGASVGIAVAPDDGTSRDPLIRNADLALYAAKDAGRGRLHFYAPDLHSRAEERGRLEQDLRDAITKGGLELHYQPVVDTASERITGFEALLRWKHPVTGWMSPAKFIPVAEETGLIGAIGEWAIRTACKDLARWPQDVRCAVNVSALQFANPNLPAIIEEALAQYGIHPGRLELEITESVFLDDNKDTGAMFAALKAIGVRLALDDFGTGYSSLGYLQNAPFDKIKIDQSFVRGATQRGSRNGAIIASITSLAQALGMDTTAEGVETLDELDLVRMYGCSHIQGYIYERPLDAEAATERLRTGLSAIAKGPKSARAARQSMLRKVVLDHQGQFYNATIRNMSPSGALIEGLWNVPPGTIFRIALSETVSVTATARWSSEERMGVEFANRLDRDAAGLVSSAQPETTDGERIPMRRSA